ncbi:MAG: RNA-directed DNA polymerase [Gammaproteobacteria bacterium]|nr:RNA-directed DNA polymerase [Gammaproteobacteria bacterium]MBU1414357.1 RNA-directed DNA polymerase [Gammaproteobacteria bacterium]
MDRTERLLERGYFPSQLPPCFKTKDLAAIHGALYASWLTLQQAPKKGAKIPKAPDSKGERFSVARAGYQRRLTSIPNPVAQTYLATHVVANWPQLLGHYRQSKLSASRPRFLRNGERGANIPSMQLLYERKVLRAAGYRFMLKTDISRFFPTIYTHSVPWALHGKAAAKRNRAPTAKYYGNLLDLSLRQCQDGQTMGLPIGPDTSHVIAEAIATSVDLELRRRLRGYPAGFRYVDDFFLFFSTMEEAEAGLAALTRALQEFELHINVEKTITCSVLEISDDYWPHQLRSFTIGKDGRKQLTDIHHFFELAKDLARKNTDENVMAYALKRASAVIIRKDNWPVFEAHLCHVVLAYPNTLQNFARILSTYADVGYRIDKERLERLVNSILEEHAPLEHHSEVAWCLWICKKLVLTLSAANVDRVSDMHSSICALILLDLDASGRLPKPPRMTYWKSVETTASLHDDLWLLSYEAGVRRWGGFSDVHVVADPHFNLLAILGVRFYDENGELTPIFQAKPRALQQTGLGLVSDLFDLADVDEYVTYMDGYGGYEGGIFFDDDDEDDEPHEENHDEDEPYF